MKVKSLSHVQLLVTPWTAAYQPPPSMGFSRQEYWSGVPLPSLIHGTTPYFSFSSYFSKRYLRTCAEHAGEERLLTGWERKVHGRGLGIK